MPPNQDKNIMNLPEEEQDVSQMEPVVMGPGAYASPDPATSENVMLPAVDDPMRTQEANAAGEAERAEKAAEDRNAGDWKALVESAKDEEALDALREEYDESGADFSTVEAAFDKRAEELNES